jgi:hypothetical protein
MKARLRLCNLARTNDCLLPNVFTAALLTCTSFRCYLFFLLCSFILLGDTLFICAPIVALLPFVEMFIDHYLLLI